MQLPVQLDDELILRWATSDDAEAIVQFNGHIHNMGRGTMDESIMKWTKNLLSGTHPTTQPQDFTVVVNKNGDIVSSSCLISQQWLYADVPFKVGRIELVGTDAAYRRRGLVRWQMNALHALSASKGELLQSITGIPWYYRQFGYEMLINLHEGRRFSFATNMRHVPSQPEEHYRLRAVTPEDVPQLLSLHEKCFAPALISRLVTLDLWQYEIFSMPPSSPYTPHIEVIETMEGALAGYVDYRDYGAMYRVNEVAPADGHSWHEIIMFLIRALKQKADDKKEEPKASLIGFMFPPEHPVMQVLQLPPPQNTPYTYYIRIPDIPAFIWHIRSVLEMRLANSVMAGYTGQLRIHAGRIGFCITFEQGEITATDYYTPSDMNDADVIMPDHTFLFVLLGHRTLAEVNHMWADCYARTPEGKGLMNVLWEKRPSMVISLG